MTLRDFNLVRDPWINALFADGQNKLVSLTELFQQWRSIVDINGSTTLNTVAIQHLLKIILLKASGGFSSVDEWKSLSEDKDLGDKVVQYLSDNQDFFTIGDPERPFLQNARNLPFIDLNDCDWLRIRGLGKKETRFGVSNPYINPPDFDGPELAQFLLREALFSIAGGCNACKTKLLAEADIKVTSNKAKNCLLSDKTIVWASSTCLRDTLLLNIPQIQVTEKDTAPWERQRPIGANPVVITTVWEAMTVLTRNSLLLWDKDKVTSVFSGAGDHYSDDSPAIINANDLLQQCSRFTDKKGKKKYLSPTKGQPTWDDTESLYQVQTDVTITRRTPAVQVYFWSKLKQAGFLPSSLSIETQSIIVANPFNNKVIVDARINTVELSSDIFDDETPAGGALYELFRFIRDVNRNFFLCDGDPVDTPKSDRERRPLTLLRNKADLFVKDTAWMTKMQTRYPMTHEFLTFAQSIFEDALAETVENPDADWEYWESRIQLFKQQVLDLAMETWNRTLLSLPLSTPRWFTGVGFAHSKVRQLRGIYQSQITVEGA